MWMWLPFTCWASVARWWHYRLTSNQLPRRWHPWWFVEDRCWWWQVAWRIRRAWLSFCWSLLKGHLMAWVIPYQSSFVGRLDSRGCRLSFHCPLGLAGYWSLLWSDWLPRHRHGVVDSSGILLSEADHWVIHLSKLRRTTGELDILHHRR